MNLTNEQIDKMEAGREMDALIAQEVMGNKMQYGCFVDDGYADDCVTDICDCVIAESLHKEKEKFPNKCQYWREVDTLPYSTDIACAWEVRKAIQLRGFDAVNISIWDSDEKPYCQFIKPISDDRIKQYIAHADTDSLAICRAALKAVISND